MATIRFYGDLKQYGTKFKLNAETAAEALNGLYLQIKGLRQNIMNGYFRVRINGQDMTEDSLKFGMHTKLADDAVIHLVPQVAGAKGGIFTTILGAALVVVGAFTSWTGVSTALIYIGAAMMAGGLSSMLTKLPSVDMKNDNQGKQNTSFSSLDNTIAQGAPVPLCYGTMKIGSKVLSQGLETI
ncbi:tail assembly protein [Orbus wheelerorum]|uniref:tail assembly protein n=1 Tax=Orbus wheelerorum TaxID=3074111 RepID=UPI00370D5E77